MTRCIQLWRPVLRASSLLRQTRHQSSVAAVSQTTTDTRMRRPTIPQTSMKSWSGADVEAVVHGSLEDMVPSEIISLSGRIFNAPVRPDLVHRVVLWQLAKRRAGTAKTKNRSEVAGSGRKIRPQKGSGRSRQGAITSPIFRGGGRAHGPVPRDYDFPLPHNVRRNALRSVLTSKLSCGQLWIVNSAAVTAARTRGVVDVMERNKWKSALIVDHTVDGISGVDATLHKASHNVRSTLAMNALGLNVYDALSFDMLVMTKAALEQLTHRYSKYDWMY